MAGSNPTNTLTSKDIRGVGDANAEFGNDTSLIVARPGGRRCCMCCGLFWFTVPEGFYALVTRFGADEDYEAGNPVWPAGLHVGPPWLKVSHLVTKQSMMFNTSVTECKTKDNVTVQIDLALVLRVMGEDPSVRPGDDPKNVRKFVHEVTARGLEKQLNDAQSEAVRTLARSITHTEVYGLRSVSTEELTGVQERLFAGAGVAPAVAPTDDTYVPVSFPPSAVKKSKVKFGLNTVEEKEEEKDLVGEHDKYDDEEAGFNVERGANVTETMKARLNAQFQRQGIEILDVIIEKITLPKEIEQQMSQKTMVISQNAEQRMQQKYDMLTLTQTEEVKTLLQSFEEQKMELKKDGHLRALEEAMDLALKRAEGQQVLKQIETQMKEDVALVNAESANAVQRIRDRTTLDSERITLTAEAESEKDLAEARATVRDVEAKAELSCAVLSSKADKAIFHAHGVSAPKIRTVKEYETDTKKIQAQDSLASNDKLVIVGTGGGKAATQMLLADAALDRGKKSFVSGKERANMLSELAVASGKAFVRLDIGDD